MDIFGGHHKNGLVLWVISMSFEALFLIESMYRFGVFFGVAKFSNLFWVCLIFQIFYVDKQ